MQVSQSTLLLGAVVLAAGSFALGRETAPTESRVVEVERPVPAADPGGGSPEVMDPMGSPDPMAAPSPSLAPDDEPAAIEWSVPAGWHTMPNPSSMRLATYAVPRVASDTADADVSVARAGGEISANIDRWVGQFAGAQPPKPSLRTVHGYEVTTVEIEGVYTNGMSAGSRPQAGWALLASIVKTRGMPYFFKMTGPAATVHAARAAFTAMIDGIHGPG